MAARVIPQEFIGQTYNRLTVIGWEKDHHGFIWFYCTCSCGNPEVRFVQKAALINGKVKSCGCYRREQLAERNRNRRIKCA